MLLLFCWIKHLVKCCRKQEKWFAWATYSMCVAFESLCVCDCPVIIIIMIKGISPTWCIISLLNLVQLESTVLLQAQTSLSLSTSLFLPLRLSVAFCLCGFSLVWVSVCMWICICAFMCVHITETLARLGILRLPLYSLPLSSSDYTQTTTTTTRHTHTETHTLEYGQIVRD